MPRARFPRLRLPQLRWSRRSRRRGRFAVPQQQRSYQLGRAAQPRPRRLPLPRLPWRGLALTALTLAIAGGLGYGGFWLIDGPALRVQQITIDGAEVADPFAIADSAGIGGKSLLILDSNEAASRVTEAVPAVKSASVRRDWPRAVTISVREHAGWGYWQSDGRRVVIDAEGLVIPAGRPPPRRRDDDLRDRRDATARAVGRRRARHRHRGQATDRGRAVAAARIVIERFEFHADRGLVVRVADGPDAIFGDWRNYAFKIAAWGALLNRIEREPIEVNEIDLRFGGQLVVR